MGTPRLALVPSSPLSVSETAHDRAGVVGALVSSSASVEQGELVQDVAERFFQQPGLEAVAVLDDGRPVGLLTRSRLLLKLARGFGHELYARKVVTRIADPHPLVVQAGTPLAEAISRALGRDVAMVYDDEVVVDEAGQFLGLVPIRDLVLHQSVVFARAAGEHESALARAHDLEQLEQQRARFLAHATHELRSPVNAIAALAEIVRQASCRGDLPAVRDRLALLLRCAAGLRATINNLLDLSRLEAGRATVACSRFPVASLLADVASTARLLAGDRPVAVQVEALAELTLETDQQKLRQVLLNLASNAVKFTDRGRVLLAAEQEPAGVRLAVSDTGCGIAPEDLGRLFLPFGQLEDALTKAHEGSGLGLVISRSLVRLLGGRIEVESRPGEGSTFSVHLPITPPEPTHS